MSNIYRISQDANNDYDTYDALVVIADSKEEARKITPNDDNYLDKREWAPEEFVKVELIGINTTDLLSGSIILTSYNAG